MKPAFLDHIGIAVTPGSRLAEALGILGLAITGTELVAREMVDTAWIPLPNQPGHVELLSPTEPASVIQLFLDKQGKDAIHHLSFRVENVKAMSERLVKEGFQLIYPEPKPGAHDCLVNFIHPRTTGGVLIEITEKQ